MNQEVKKKWVAALRSGEYEQGECHLRHADNTFCCLGVLCDLYIKEKRDMVWVLSSLGSDFLIGGYDSYLPTPVCDWADLDTSPEIKFEGTTVNLVDLNDNGVLKFEELADLIEAQY